MDIIEKIEAVSKYSMLKLSRTEADGLIKDMQVILSGMEKIKDMPAEDKTAQNITGMLREDIEEKSLSRAELLKNTPETDGEYVIVGYGII